MLTRLSLYRMIFIIILTAPFFTSANILTPSKNVKNFSNSELSLLKVVQDINQDQQGYMWFATTSGLFRFDGYSLREYSPQAVDNTSIPHFHVNQLLVRDDGEIWVGTSFGLAIYQKKSDDFKRIQLNKERPELSPVIVKLFEDSHHNIWVGTRKHGVFKVSPNRKEITQYINTEFNKTLTDNFIKDIFEDENGYIWFASVNGLNRYDVISGQISHYLASMKDTKSSYFISSIMQHSKNTLLLGTDRGLVYFNVNSKKVSRPEKNTSRLFRARINTLEKGVNGEVIFGTNNKGVGLISSKSDLVGNYQTNHTGAETLVSNTIYSLFLDNKKNLWIGTNKGVSRVDNNQAIFSLYKEGNNHCLPGKESYAILSDSKEVLWVGIRGKGLQKIDLKQGICKLFNSLDIDGKKVNLDFVLDIKEDRQGNIWIANYQEGLVKFNTHTSTFSRFNAKNKKISKLLDSAFIYKIEIGEDNKVWLGLEDFGLIELDIVEETTRVLTKSIDQQLGKKISTVKTLQKFNNKLWLTTSYQGLISIDLSTYEVTQFVREEKNQTGIPENISAARVDDKGNLWLGSRGYGLFKFNTNSNELENHTKFEGLADNTIWNIETDNNGFIWIGTGDGLSVFDPANMAFTNYYTSDGLQSNEATTSGFFDKKTGVIWTGGMNGINKIDTNKFQDRVRDKASVPELDDIKVNYKSINFQNNDNINLGHSENNLTFYFSSINFKTPKKVKYRYKLDGFDQWRVVDFNSRLAHYTNLSPGVYTFKVSASLNNEWSNDEASIKIIINPPWWQTNLAYFLFICAFISLVFSIIYFRTRLLMNKANSLERSVMERTKELVKEKHKVELLLSRKNEEFANVSHELRTPLTLIQGPVTKLMAESTDNEQLKRLSIIQRNAIRLTRIVDQLFHIETFRIKSISGRSNQVTKVIILRIIEAFKDLAQEKNIQLNVTKIANVNLEFTPDALEKIILNLISNALKYTQAGGTITIETYRSKSKELAIKISDTGVGIPKDKLGVIFERYSRVQDENSEKVTGAGIGLALVKSLIDSHNGRIELQSKLGIGTEVTVYLPIINETLEGSNQTFINDEFITMELMELNHQQKVSLMIQDVAQQSIKGFEKPLVLLIEDNTDMRAYITDSISSDYKVIIAENGDSGITKAISEVPDLIISDIMMPKKDGYQVTNELRLNNITSHIPIVLLTARGDRESRLKGWYEKADEYLTKPFDAEELLIRLKNLLEIRNILKQQFSESSFQIDEKSSKPKAEVCSITAENIAKQKKFINQLNEILEVLYINSDTSIANIASEIAMSERQFFRKIKSVLDMTPAEYLRRFRLEKAKILLELGNNASYAAFEVGFSSQSYFGKCFKAQFGLSPSEYKKELQILYPKKALIPFEDS